MSNNFFDKEKIGIFKNIQQNLKGLPPSANNRLLDQFMKIIPQQILTQKDDFMTLCLMIAYYTRISPLLYKKVGIKIFERLLPIIKEQLQNESNFLWNIFGGQLYFKLWMHEEGLISIETIIQSAQIDKSKYVARYFLPEIVNEAPEIYEKEIKFMLNSPKLYNQIDQFKKLREKHFKWLRLSGNYHDSIYPEIEDNKLRLAIKRDDIDTFQKIVSNMNLPVDIKIEESVIENTLLSPSPIPLIEYASQFNSINIFKFLYLNDAEFDQDSIFFAMRSRNYEIYHIAEKSVEKIPILNTINISIGSWDGDLTEYNFNKFDFDFKKSKEKAVVEVIGNSMCTFNFTFLEETVCHF